MHPIYSLEALKKLYYTDPAYASCKLMLGQQFHYRAHFPVYSGQMLVQSTNKYTYFIVFFKMRMEKYLKSLFIVRLI